MFNVVTTFCHFPDTTTKYVAIDDQVCFHRRSFSDPVKPQRSTTGSIGPLMGTNKVAWGVKLLLMIISSYQVDCGSFSALLKTTLLFVSLWMVLPAFSFPPPLSPSIYFIDNAGVAKNHHKNQQC